MNHLKLFETFFSYFLNDKLSERDINILFGISREDIEDCLMEINDLGLYNISINFKVNDRFISSDEYEVHKDHLISKYFDEEGGPISRTGKGYISKINKLSIDIHVFLTNNSLSKIHIRKNIRERGIKPDILLPKLLECYNQFKVRFSDFEVTEKHPETVDNSISHHPEAKLNNGHTIISFFMKKKGLN
jgi:hypothetical protein